MVKAEKEKTMDATKIKQLFVTYLSNIMSFECKSFFNWEVFNFDEYKLQGSKKAIPSNP